jgi:hypothetical protein
MGVFPVELLDHIFSHCSRNDLANIARVNHTAYGVAILLIYHTLECTSVRQTFLALNTIGSKPELARLIRKFLMNTSFQGAALLLPPTNYWRNVHGKWIVSRTSPVSLPITSRCFCWTLSRRGMMHIDCCILLTLARDVPGPLKALASRAYLC